MMQEYSTTANGCSQESMSDFLAQLVQRNLLGVIAANCPEKVEPKRLDEEAKALVVSCMETVRSLAWRYAGGSYDRFEELTSIGLVGLCEAASYVPADVANPIGYLVQAAKNQMLSELRSMNECSVKSLDASLSEDGSFSLYDVVPDRSSHSSSSLTPTTLKRVRALNGAVQRLSPRQRAAVRQRAGFPGYGVHSLKEMERALRCSERAVHSLDYNGRLNLARDARLRKVMGV